MKKEILTISLPIKQSGFTLTRMEAGVECTLIPSAYSDQVFVFLPHVDNIGRVSAFEEQINLVNCPEDYVIAGMLRKDGDIDIEGLLTDTYNMVYDYFYNGLTESSDVPFTPEDVISNMETVVCMEWLDSWL